MAASADQAEQINRQCIALFTRPAGEWAFAVRCEKLIRVQFERLGYRSTEKLLEAFLNRRLGVAPLLVTDDKRRHYKNWLLRIRQVCACIPGFVDIEEMHI